VFATEASSAATRAAVRAGSEVMRSVDERAAGKFVPDLSRRAECGTWPGAADEQLYSKEARVCRPPCDILNGRGEWIRTTDPSVPNRIGP